MKVLGNIMFSKILNAASALVTTDIDSNKSGLEINK